MLHEVESARHLIGSDARAQCAISPVSIPFLFLPLSLGTALFPVESTIIQTLQQHRWCLSRRQ